MEPLTFSRLVITGDVLRPFPDGHGGWESATYKNIRWLWSLLGPAADALGIPSAMLAWDPVMPPEQGEYFDTPLAYHLARGELPDAGLTLSIDGWSRLCGVPKLPEPVRALLVAKLRGALVVGYEMPDVIARLLSEESIPFLDVILYPVRFLDDLVFALRTNITACHRLLVNNRLSEDSVRQQAALIRAKTAWMPRPLPLPPGSALILGQVGNDRALLRPDGGFISLGDHLIRLHRLCCEHPQVVFKPHPYDQPDSPSQRAVCQLPVIQWTRANFYHLLGQPEIEAVVALNSSGLIEASYFDKRSEALAPCVFSFGEDPPAEGIGPGAAVPQDGRWIEPAFWRALLSGSAACVATPPPPANRLRRTMNADWGYGFIEKVVAS